MIPALLTRTSIGPSSFSAASRKRSNERRLGDVELEGDAAAAELGRGLLGEREVEVADRDPGAAADQRRRRRLADPAGSARDRDDLAVETT